ncbi:Prolyl 3-hydroxylase 1 [Nymphon striatum]|nr:Prolyl 3-hydroxylase 1 [Nymphon striatum]
MLSSLFTRRVIVLLSLISIITIGAEANNHFHTVYKLGVDAYLEERWSDCIAYLQNSVDMYFEMEQKNVKCRESCKNTSPVKSNFTYSDYYDNLDFYYNVVEEAFCIVKCKYDKMSGFPEPADIPANVNDEFQSRLPYDYLQICYFKLGDNQQAANFAYSFLLHHPKNTVMLENLKYYLSLENVLESELENVEAKPYQKPYMEGERYYQKKDFKKVIKSMKKCLKLYLKSEQECRVLCEGPYKPQDSQPDFILATADHFLYSLKCKNYCAEKLSFFNNIKHENFIPEIFNYLQFSYFKLTNNEETCKAVANFLTLLPKDEIMNQNKEFYLKKGVCSSDMFVAQKEIIEYEKRKAKEENVLKYIKEWSIFTEENEKKKSKNDLKTKIHHPSLQMLEWSQNEGFKLQMGDRELNGTLRFVADGFATEEECSDLINLANDGTLEGDGYKGKSPHTKNEKFLGLGISRLAELIKSKTIEPKQAKMLLDLSEKARVYVEKYFHLNGLYFDFTHLVCRTSLETSDDKRDDDLSHAIHSDNCIVQSDGSCNKNPPAYTWRDYSAILYLNDGFQGGDFFFSDHGYKKQAVVRPRCGRVVGFAADNWHGVNAVLKGQRCCLAMWFTLDPKHDEVSRSKAYSFIEEYTRHTEM